MLRVNLEEKRLLIQRIQNLPTLPATLARIIEVVENPSSTASELGEVISRDQSLSSMILKLVNSAFYGHLRQISSISHATVILGFQTVKTMALGVSVFHSSPSRDGDSLDKRRLWIHSLAVATCAKRLASTLEGVRGSDEETVFLAGLLHDIGKVVFDNVFSEDYRNVLRLARNERMWIGDAEKKILEMDHAEAGSLLARKWQFPYPVINAIRRHHDPLNGGEEGSESVIDSLVSVADYVCRKIKLGHGGDDEEAELNPTAARRLRVTDEILARTIQRMESEREEIEKFTFD